MKTILMVVVATLIASCAMAQDQRPADDRDMIIREAIRANNEFQRKIKNSGAIAMNKRLSAMRKRIAKLEKAARKTANVATIQNHEEEDEGYTPSLPEVLGGLLVVTAGAAAAKNAKGKAL